MLYIMGALEQSEMHQESALRSMLYENVKHHPLMALAIDKFRSARETSSKRTAKWLMQKTDETIELAQQDENTTFVEKALQTTGGKQVPANPGKPDKNAKASNEKPDKKSKEEKPPTKKDKEKPDKLKKDQKGQPTESSASVNAAPGPSKGAGKGKKSDSKKQLSKEEKAKEPCMYFAFSSRAKGDKCPYLHDKNNFYKGSKPKSLEKNTPAGSATVHAGAAKLLAGSMAASSVVGLKQVATLWSTLVARHGHGGDSQSKGVPQWERAKGSWRVH